jgi:AraC family transcriptional regulator
MATLTGRSSAAAGWSEEVTVEHWSLPPTESFANTMVRHRLVVFLGSSPVVFKWNDDGRPGRAHALPGAINIMPLGSTTVTQWQQSLRVAAFEFSSALIQRLLDGNAPAPTEQLFGVRNAVDAVAHDLARRILAELETPTERLYGELLCVALAVHLLKRYGRGDVKAVGFKSRLSPVRASRVLEYIHANLVAGLTLSRLAQLAGISEGHFARAFRATFDESPHRLVLRWRLERAARLVAADDMSLAEAAIAAGFCDQAHFTRTMRRHFGETPGRLLKIPKLTPV